ncbi:Guanylate cyclase soluble subunit beta-2 [Symbiodinium microadriaticum]|uniref:Guanylate cyclase soluble subunit beta-2 n=1 Tax=Symbiodinium microadriaticum TaxID=2951 RepID=A0A1Q9E8N0_SYMMI|nr:Guanylate cyclase soluble subunit beta-2 [Symbiodinium microadriaticum]
MNHDPVLSVEVDRASILFVMFVDFDQTARKCCRLRFWVEALAVCSDFRNMVCDRNHYFTKFDDICSAHEVTKIETVGEECAIVYVSAVGVIPRDIEAADKALGHAVILGRLIKAAKEILMVQRDTQGSDEEVKLKMGIHTGPVAHGLDGEVFKSRFRLFGDTINTAARLMQKVAYRWRDNIEMKGKGKVSVESLWVEACFPEQEPEKEQAQEQEQEQEPEPEQEQEQEEDQE